MILTKEQIEQVVKAICSEIPDEHHALWYFGEAIRNNELIHLFTEDQIDLLDECSLTYQEDTEEEDDYDDEDEEEDEDEEDGETELTTYDIQRSYPWSSGSWNEDENSLDESLKEEVTRVIENIIEDRG